MRILGYILTAAVLHVVVFALSADNNHQDVDDFLVGITLVQRQMDPLAAADTSVKGKEHLVAEPAEHPLAELSTKVSVAEGKDAIDETNIQELTVAVNYHAPEADEKLANVVEKPPRQSVQKQQQQPPSVEPAGAASPNRMSALHVEQVIQQSINNNHVVAETVPEFQRLLTQQQAFIPATSQNGDGMEEAMEPFVAQMTAQPRYGYNPAPAYPRLARDRGWEGTVEFKVRVLTNGKVGEVTLKNSSGYRSLDDAARKAIKRWRFDPAHRAGRMVESWVVIPVHFVLDAQTRSR